MNRVASKLHLHGLASDSTDELMVRLQVGDALAFEELYRRMFPIIRNFLAARAAKPQLIDDCIQEVFCRVWEQRGRFTAGAASARTYLFAIAVNVVRELSRADCRLHLVPRKLAFRASSYNENENRCEAGLHSEALTRARAGLPDNQSRAIALVYDQMMSTTDASKLLGCSEKALRRRIDRARNKLYCSVVEVLGR
jgi:RNA polymerase sigma-70 factor (ECF subfamily)